MARGRPTLATIVLDRGDDRARRPGLGDVRRRVPDHGRRLRQGWGYSVVVALGVVLAAMYTLAVISAILHVKPGRAVREEALDLRVGELALVLPMILLLLGLSVWPHSSARAPSPGYPRADGGGGWTAYPLEGGG
jgi:hypothetical protein